MAGLNRNLPPIDVSRFSMVPRSDIPRSTFATQHSVKMPFQAGLLIPCHVDEVLPGDVHQGKVTIFARLNTLLFPMMDNVTLETFFFFVPNRLLWVNWVKMMGERHSPADSISFTTPQIVSPAGGFAINSVYDYMGLPCVGQIAGGATISVNALPLRAYDLIFQEWFRDENLDTSVEGFGPEGDGPDANAAYFLHARRKKHDYFTSCLPFPVKGGLEANFPLQGLAYVEGIAFADGTTPTAGSIGTAFDRADVFPAGDPGWAAYYGNLAAGPAIAFRAVAPGAGANPNIYVDLSTTVGASLNAIRLAVATQQILERDARGGTRYTELIQAHFGVFPEDSRLQRPEYIGGGRSRVETQAIPQTAPNAGSQILGGLAAQATVADRHEFSYHATEHGWIIGLVHVTGDVTYQQGLPRMWTRLTRYDHYWPAFANLGEQAVRNDEIYCRGDANDTLTFGYQERWAEYRHRPSRIAGLFRSTHAGTIHQWHLAQQFSALPVLNSAFITDACSALGTLSNPMSRALAAGVSADNMQVLFDSVFDIACTRAMPVYSVPGLDRF